MRFYLTDEEWAVIEPFLPKGGRAPCFARRASTHTIRYATAWARSPNPSQAIAQNHQGPLNWRNRGPRHYYRTMA